MRPCERFRLVGRVEFVTLIDDMLPPRDPNGVDDEDEEDEDEVEDEKPAVIREPDE